MEKILKNLSQNPKIPTLSTFFDLEKKFYFFIKKTFWVALDEFQPIKKQNRKNSSIQPRTVEHKIEKTKEEKDDPNDKKIQKI